MESFPANTDIEFKTWKKTFQTSVRTRSEYMLSAEQIDKVSAHALLQFRLHNTTLAEVVTNAINEALALAEKTKWKYPEKGELPEILADYIIFYLRVRLSKPKIGMAYKDKDGNFMFFCNDTKQGYSQHEVKAWTYAPVLNEEPLPRSERLEKLTAERDALLKEDQ